MKKQYTSPKALTIMVSVEGMLASSPQFGSHDEVSTGAQLSNSSTWNSELWAASDDEE